MNEVLNSEQLKKFNEMKVMSMDEAVSGFKDNQIKAMTVSPNSVVNCIEYICGVPWRVQLVFDKEQTEWESRCSSRLDRIMQVNGLRTQYFKNGEVFTDLAKNIRLGVMEAYFLETGFSTCSHKAKGWAVDDEMIQWFACNMPKIESSVKSIYDQFKPAFAKVAKAVDYSETEYD